MTETRFANRRAAFVAGIQAALGAPMAVLFAGMVGFGAMGRSNGFDVSLMLGSSLLMFALPGQVVLFEMLVTGSSLFAMVLAVTLSSTRFITMTVTLFPQFHRRDRNNRLYAAVHVLAMTAWAVSMREFQSMPAKHRLAYFLGLAVPCWLVSVPGTYLGYQVAGWVSPPVTLALVFLNPLFFLLTFTEVKPWGNRLAIALGCVLGPLFFLWDSDTSLLTTGVVGGSMAYWIDRRWLRPAEQGVGA